jgi:hypothetical protein
MKGVATTMDSEQLEFLRKQDWENIAVKLGDWSIWCAQLFGWPEKLLPLGKTPEDMAYDVINAFWNEDNTYNPKWALMTQLKRAVRRNYSNLFRLESVKKTSLFDEDDPPDVADESLTPEETASIQNEFDKAIQALLLHPKVQRSDDLQLVVTAYACGFWDEADLARETGLKMERIYQLNRELKDIYPSIKKQLRQDGGSCQ